MTDEFDLIAQARPEVRAYSPAAKASARRRLTAVPSRRKPYGIAIAGVAVVAGASVVAVNVLTATPGGTGHAPAVAALPKVTNMSASEVLGRAAQAVTDLKPRNDQFIKVISQTMSPVMGGHAVSGNDPAPPPRPDGAVTKPTGQTSTEFRYLYQAKRTIWLSADGSKDGALKTQHLKPQAYPGWPIPEGAYAEAGSTELLKLPTCGYVPETTYTKLKRLPADVEGMRAYLYSGAVNKNPPDARAWTSVGDLLRETYMPAAQRAALFKAAATIPGVKVTAGVTDAAGRTGIGVGRASIGIRSDIIFDAKTFELLGERGTVVDEKEAKSPVGSVVASTAQLQVSVTDTVPKAPDPISEKKGVSCG
ncbi:hypothetical protein Psi02_06120 [Planotetraspora silvatica]|uniref:CU044_5270 family protein n=1 Tax=Planotetraspora silvatica TaxID=234614 RepID=A0A8J3UEP9_9ACTN|nr:CU044_5270 family protein [Planotetraspora silvatica]GII44188.1 hypothetical protein Psi02_06120 [Planotetraspora silvatica]